MLPPEKKPVKGFAAAIAPVYLGFIPHSKLQPTTPPNGDRHRRARIKQVFGDSEKLEYSSSLDVLR